jgi:hypothetical protein
MRAFHKPGTKREHKFFKLKSSLGKFHEMRTSVSQTFHLSVLLYIMLSVTSDVG